MAGLPWGNLKMENVGPRGECLKSENPSLESKRAAAAKYISSGT